MLYALVLVVTSTTMIQPVTQGPWSYPVGQPYLSSETSQKTVGYYRTRQGCLGADISRSHRWPDLQPGQTVTGFCVQVEMPANGVDIEVYPGS